MAARVSKLPVLEGTVKDCFIELSSNVPSFLDHTYLFNGNSIFEENVRRTRLTVRSHCIYIAFSEIRPLCCERTRSNAVSPLVKLAYHSFYWSSLVSE